MENGTVSIDLVFKVVIGFLVAGTIISCVGVWGFVQVARAYTKSIIQIRAGIKNQKSGSKNLKNIETEG